MGSGSWGLGFEVSGFRVERLRAFGWLRVWASGFRGLGLPTRASVLSSVRLAFGRLGCYLEVEVRLEVL